MRFVFVSGDPALDLAGTVESRRDDPVDLLASPPQLERWVAACPGLPDHRVPADNTSHEAALVLREATYALALDRVLNRPFDSGSLTIVNAAAARPPATIELGNDGRRISGDLIAVLAYVARSGIEVLADPRARFKECVRPGCTRIFLDRSHGARRTWCGMEACGNRVKAAAYRARRRTSA